MDIWDHAINSIEGKDSLFSSGLENGDDEGVADNIN